MTLAQELMRTSIAAPARGRGREIIGGGLRLAFNGKLSEDELLMAFQHAFEWADWETEE